ncbi:hypothetical protein VD0002_g1651 [Verticillium dahliae]|uniref:Phospholipid-binding protein n=1 Tax=Verticillium dahliae TaxID=27337 RepID=A0AA44WIH2_VERDA|nr:hypothetical protein EV126DRAFT_356713 [Verticillium dahliae]PNH31392.1 hypothetical protein BJF96_g5304 [Verticillium dahliae]PNH54325.1 hypothetical protein VD0003_g3180 [Verticillium dahliae]PNH68408.1 hypothetical protein VD0002_g1651 [Verticillium dahliae]
MPPSMSAPAPDNRAASPTPSQLPPVPGSPSFSLASTANPLSAYNLPLPPPPRPSHAVLSKADLDASQTAYADLLATAKSYRLALASLSTAASAFGSALESCARLKEARAEPLCPTPQGASLSNSFHAAASSACTADTLLSASGVHHLVANHHHILSETVYRSFEVPLLHELDKWRQVVEDEDESYAANIRDKSKEIRRLEKEGLKLHRQRRRDVNGFRAHLVDLTTKLDGLTSLHGDHARTLLRESQDTSGKIVDASCSLVRAEVDIFESLARKGWTGGGLEDLLERGRDLFASEAQDDGGIGGGGGGGSSADPAKLFSILPPRSILADASGGDAARTTAAGGGGHGRSDSLLVDDAERYQSLIGAATVSPGGDEAETASVFSNSGFNRPRGARPFSPQPIRRDPTNVTYDDTLGVVGMSDAGLGHLVVQRLEAAVEEEHDEEHEEHEEHDDEELRRDGAPARETHASEDMAESGGVQAAETLEDGVKDDDGERGRARRWSVNSDERSE